MRWLKMLSFIGTLDPQAKWRVMLVAQDDQPHDGSVESEFENAKINQRFSPARWSRPARWTWYRKPDMERKAYASDMAMQKGYVVRK